MAKTARICVKIDPLLKEEAEKVFQDLGLSASSAITMYYKQIVAKQGIPFEVSLKKEKIEEPLDISKLTHDQLIAEIEKGYKDIEEGRVYDAKEVFEELRKEFDI